uniref:Uncharacterized protein n=1 Tax=Caenorhabditis japonica TaxID=281687 RepID=A0A8R1E3T6_CAEJA
MTNEQLADIVDTRRDILDHIEELQTIGHDEESRHIEYTRTMMVIVDFLIFVGELPYLPEHEMLCVVLEQNLKKLQEVYVVLLQYFPPIV